MAFILKSPAKTVTVDPATLDKTALHKAIDKYHDALVANEALKAQIAELEVKKVDLSLLEKDLMELVPQHYPTEWAAHDKEFFVESKKNKLKLGKMGIKRTIIDMAAIFKKMGKDAFLAACSFPLKAVDDYLTPAEKEGVLSIEDTKRNVTLAGAAETKKGK
ncbi:hypothetical protein EVB27_020 [Rhizobium phage RHph_TM16]|nr:hypothetical protein EVB27_020 [Rhizobium phage RHph_TM16]